MRKELDIHPQPQIKATMRVYATRQVTTDEVANRLQVSNGSAYKIIYLISLDICQQHLNW
jgi:hypothetical protein